MPRKKTIPEQLKRDSERQYHLIKKKIHVI